MMAVIAAVVDTPHSTQPKPKICLVIYLWPPFPRVTQECFAWIKPVISISSHRTSLTTAYLSHMPAPFHPQSALGIRSFSLLQTNVSPPFLLSGRALQGDPCTPQTLSLRLSVIGLTCHTSSPLLLCLKITLLPTHQP